MAYELIPISDLNNVPDYVRGDGPSELTKSLMRSGGSNIKRISIRGRVFRCVINGEEVAKNKSGYMDVIILNVAPNYNRTYYEGAYDPKAEAKPPRCWSPDSKHPAKDVPNPLASECDSCPMNIKGSGQGDSRACRMKRRMAVALATDLDSGVFQIELPGASIFGKGDGEHMPANQYFRYVGSQNYNIERVVTRMYFDDDADNPKLFFTVVAFPSQKMLPKLAELINSDEAREAVDFQVFQTDGVAPSTAKTAKLPPPVVMKDEEEEEEEEEVVVVKKKKAKKVVEVEEDEEDEDSAPAAGGFGSINNVAAPTVINKPTAKSVEPTKKGSIDLNSVLSAFGSRSSRDVDDED
jgi:hypothetical protein